MVLAAAAAMVSTAVAAADSVVSTADNDDKDWSALTRSLTAAASNETALVSGLLLTFKQLFLDPQEPGRGGEEIESLFSFSGTIGSPPFQTISFTQFDQFENSARAESCFTFKC